MTKFRKTVIFIVIAFLAIVLGALFFGKKNGKVSYKTEPLVKRTIIQVVEASGTINPVTTVSIGSQVSGMINEIYADFNSVVKKGDLLAQIDTSLFEAQLRQSQANIDNARASLARIQAVAQNDKLTLTRYKNLYQKGFISKAELDLAESTYASDVAQIKAAQAQINQAMASYSTAESNMRYTRIISPVDGVVIARKVDVGQTVAASFQTPELFSVAQDLTKMQIEASVSEADIGKVQVGQQVEYTLDGYQDSVFEGRVRQVRISPTTVQNVVTYTVVIDVNNEDLKLKPGMTANVAIVTDKKTDILAIPNTALKFTPHKDGSGKKYEKQGIWILSNGNGGKLERIEIEIGSNDDSFTEILSKHLKEGDHIVVSVKEKNEKEGSQNRGPGMRMF